MSFEQTVARIRDSIDIVDVISRFVPLKRSGRNFKGVCPFHSEKTPSFMVSQEKQIFRCFGCGCGGDVIKFVQEYEKVTFMEAMKMLASQAGIEIETSPQQRANRDEKEQLAEINKLACAFFIHTLKGEGKNGPTHKYLAKRKISPESIEKFQIGLAPDGWQGLLDFLAKKGFKNEQVEAAGLAIRKDNGGFYDRFRARLMFPIQSVSGAVIGFGGRVMREDDNGPKYLNSPENILFVKSRTLYGLNFGRRDIIDRSHAILGEGYLDVIRAHQEGFSNTVASLGTAFTKDHCAIIKRYTQDVVLAYDGDKAGQGAAVRGGDIFVHNGVRVKVAVFPKGHDPDSFLRDNGSDAFTELISNAPGLFEFRLEWLRGQFDMTQDSGRVEVARRMMEFIAPVSDPILKDLYINRLSEETGLSRKSLLDEGRTKPLPRKRPPKQEAVSVEADDVDEKEIILSRELEDLLRVILSRPVLARRAVDEILSMLEENTFAAKLIVKVADSISGEDELDLPALVDFMQGRAAKNIVTRLALDNQDIGDPEVFFRQIAIKLQMSEQKKIYENTLTEIKKIEKNTDPEGKNIQKILKLNQDLLESKVFLCNLEKKLVEESSKYIIDSSLSN